MTSTRTRPVDNVVIATKGLQDRNTNIIAGTTVENKGKLILIYDYNFENIYTTSILAKCPISPNLLNLISRLY